MTGFFWRANCVCRQIKSLARGGVRETAVKRELRRRVTFDEVVKNVEQMRGASWEDLKGRRGDPARGLVIWALRRYSGLTLREIGAALGGVDYAAVGMALKRFEGKAEGDRGLRRQMKELGQVLNVVC